MRRVFSIWILCVWFVLLVEICRAGNDWPMWRYDASRTAASPEELPGQLYLQWKRELPRPIPAFPYDVRLCFDMSYEPVVMGRLIFVPSMVTDSVAAFDTETGVVRWRFFAEGPVRFAPVACRGKVYFVSDDGYLYCVQAQDGRLLWRVRGAPPRWKERKLLGHGRMVSRWPALGGPVLADGKIFFAAGFWTNEGVYVCAVDAESGRLIWRNENCSFVDTGSNDHGGRWYGGLCPQGYLSVIAGKLAVPNGRALPAFFDLKSGKMEPYTSGWGGRYGLGKGSWWVCGMDDYFFDSGDMFGASGDAFRIEAPQPGNLLTIREFSELSNTPLHTVEQWVKQKRLKTVERDGRILIRPYKPESATYLAWWTSNPPEGERCALETRPRLQISPMNRKESGVFREPVLTRDAIYYSKPGAYVSRPLEAKYSEIVAYDITHPRWGLSVTEGWGGNPLLIWKTLKFDRLWSISSDLKVHIKAGRRLYCGGRGVVAALDIPGRNGQPRFSWQAQIDGVPSTMVAADGKLFVVTRSGALYCFGQRQVNPKIYERKIATAKPGTQQWTQMVDEILSRAPLKNGYCLAIGLGTGKLIRSLLSASEMHIIVLEADSEKVSSARREFHSQGLYGTRVHVLQGTLASMELPPYFASVVLAEREEDLNERSGRVLVERIYRCLRPYGGIAYLPFSSKRHEAFVKEIKDVKLFGSEVEREGELTLLRRAGALPGAGDWTHRAGGPGNTYASNDRAAKPPFGLLWFGGSMHRIFRYRGFNTLAVSQGRMFLAMPGEIYTVDIYTGRRIWTKSISANDVIATDDSVYVMTGGVTHRLAPSTGSELGTIRVPPQVSRSGKERWRAACRISGKYFVGITGGNFLVCVDRHNGQMLWKLKCAKDGLNFALGSDKVFCVDYWLPLHTRRGEQKEDKPGIFALDIRTGRAVWETTVKLPPDTADAATKERFGPLKPQLAYCDENDILVLTAVRATLCAYRGRDGTLLWQENIPCKDFPSAFSAPRPPIVLPKLLITHAGAMYDLRTGSLLPMRLWFGANRGGGGTRGCGRALANRCIVTVRDAHASYFDLSTGCQMYMRGTRAGCGFNLIPADGLFLAPYNAWSCTCNYGIRTSFALTHIPEAALWLRDAFKGEKRLRLTTRPGETVEFNIVVRNWSNSNVTDKLQFEIPGGWSVTPELSKMVVNGQGSVRHVLQLKVPQDEAEGMKRLRIMATLPVLSPEPSLVEVRVSK